MNQFIQIVVGGLLQGSVFAIIALGISLVYRVTGIINLAQGGFCIVGALMIYSFQLDLGWPTPLAFIAAVAATTAFGVALGAATFVPALARLADQQHADADRGPAHLHRRVDAGRVGQPALYRAAVFRRAADRDLRHPRADARLLDRRHRDRHHRRLWYLLARTAVGKALVACAENPIAARFMGIDVARMTLFSFGLAAAIGAIGGIVVAPIISLQFDTGGFFTNVGFIAVALGGMASLPGAIAGGLFLGVAEQLAAGYVSSLFANGLALALLLVTLLWRPQGFFGGRARRQDVRDEQRVHRAVIRFEGRGAVIGGGALLLILLALPSVVGAGMLSSLVITCILFIAVLGLDVAMGYAGQVSLGQAGFMAIGGYTAAILATNYDVAPLLGMVAGMVLSLVCALLLSLVTIRLRGAYLALATLAFSLLIDSLTVGLVDVTGGPSGLVGIPSFSLGTAGARHPARHVLSRAGVDRDSDRRAARRHAVELRPRA